MWTTSAAPGSTRQAALHEAIAQLGGYWRPLAAIARVLEELGEFLAVVDPGALPSSRAAAAAELADLWIISTCLASQYCVDIADPVDDPGDRPVGGAADLARELVIAAGELARVVNYYDGPKAPRRLDGWTPLRVRLPAFHRCVRQLAAAYRLDLVASIDEKIAGMCRRDLGRFAPQYDPSMSRCLNRFRPLADRMPGGSPGPARLWGAPDWRAGATVAENGSLIGPFLSAFAKCAPHELLDGFVVMPDTGSAAAPAAAPAGGPDEFLDRFLQALAAVDPVPDKAFAGDVNGPRRHYAFGGEPMRVRVFSPLYGHGDPRHSPEATFVAFQVGRAAEGDRARTGPAAGIHPHPARRA